MQTHRILHGRTPMLALATSLMLAACADAPPTAPDVSAMAGGPSRIVNTPAGLVAERTITGGGLYVLGIRPDGTVASWSSVFDYPVKAIPAGLANVVALAAWGDHALALKADGTVVAWGDNWYGQTSTPALTGVVAIGAGAYHSLAVRSDGTAVGWGYDRFGQATVPPALTDVVAVAGGQEHSLALRRNGTVVGWGFSDYGQADPPAGLNDAVAIAAGRRHSAALRRDGTVVTWGADVKGVPTGLSSVAAIATGAYHTLALKSDGTVVAWGDNAYGQSSVPAGLSDVVAIGAGQVHSVALRRNGTVVVWGWSLYPNTPPPSFTVRVPNSAPSAGEVTHPTGIVSGHRYTFAIAASDPDGDALTYAWDMNSDGVPEQASTLNSIYHGFAAGTQTVRVTVSDAQGLEVQRSVTFGVEQNAAPGAEIQPIPAVQEGTVVYPRAVVTDANSATDPTELKYVTYRWDFGDGTFSTSATPSKRYNDNGTYTIRLTVTDRGGASSTTETQVQVANVPPRATFVTPVSAAVIALDDFALSARSVTDQALNDRGSLEVAFDCGGGYDAYTADTGETATCVSPAAGSRLTVGLRVRDNDGGVAEYRRTYTVR